MRCTRRRAFTLIELLVVVAIIAVLIAILVPALSRARANAVTSACLANQRSIGQAMTTYAADNDWVIPIDGGSGVMRAFFAPLLAPYMGGPPTDWNNLQYDWYVIDYLRPLKVFKCPGLRKDNDVWIIHYEVNGLDFPRFYRTGGYAEPVPGFVKTALVRRPADAVYCAEVNGSEPPPSIGSVQFYSYKHLPFYTDLDSGQTEGTARPNPRMIAATDQRHRGRTTVSFFDGHAEAVPLTYNFWRRRVIAGEQ